MVPLCRLQHDDHQSTTDKCTFHFKPAIALTSSSLPSESSSDEGSSAHTDGHKDSVSALLAWEVVLPAQALLSVHQQGHRHQGWALPTASSWAAQPVVRDLGAPEERQPSMARKTCSPPTIVRHTVAVGVVVRAAVVCACRGSHGGERRSRHEQRTARCALGTSRQHAWCMHGTSAL